MDSKNVVVHIGMNKTGSSFLQKQVFPLLPAVYYDQPRFAATHRFVVMTDEKKDALRRELSQYNGRRIVLSHEGLSGEGDARSREIPQLLHELFPEARILVVVRNQIDYVLSFWFYEVEKELCAQSLQDYITKGREQLLAKLQYDQVLEEYGRVFGPERVKMLLFEDMRQDWRGFVRSMLEFMDMDCDIEQIPYKHVNKSSYNARYITFIRGLNRSMEYGVGALRLCGLRNAEQAQHLLTKWGRFKRNYFLPPVRRIVPPGELSMPERWRDELHKMFAESNVRLQSRLGRDISEFGYPLPD